MSLMGRQLPTECDQCGGVNDWGDFGPEDDEPACTCEPELVVWLRTQHLDAVTERENYRRIPGAHNVAEWHDGAIQAYDRVIVHLLDGPVQAGEADRTDPTNTSTRNTGDIT